MARKWSELYNKLPEDSRQMIEARVRETVREIALGELRKARRLTQKALAEQLDIDQGAVSKIEKRTDMYLSTLRSYVEALGGKLELRAVFPHETIDLELSRR